MDSQAQRKALFRAKLREAAHKQDIHIDSLLVRYNEHNQPICKVCDVTLKSALHWPAHQASRKHNEAISNLKAAANSFARADVEKSDSPSRASTENPRTVSSLPANFFDKEAKKPKIANGSKGGLAGQMCDSMNNEKSGKATEARPSEQTGEMSTNEGLESKEVTTSDVPKKESLESKRVTSTLPEGFFDNKDADLRARGIEPIKVDIKDEYKEFEKAIQDDLNEVDERLEEEEIDAAEMIEEAESLEQKAYRERVAMLKKQQMEMKVTKFSHAEKKPPKFRGEHSSEESSSDDDEGISTVDWRAQHL